MGREVNAKTGPLRSFGGKEKDSVASTYYSMWYYRRPTEWFSLRPNALPTKSPRPAASAARRKIQLLARTTVCGITVARLNGSPCGRMPSPVFCLFCIHASSATCVTEKAVRAFERGAQRKRSLISQSLSESIWSLAMLLSEPVFP
jgi:hypothetical protein